MSAPVGSPLPTRCDNRSRVRKILDQGPEGACTGFAVCAAAEMLFGSNVSTAPDLSERWAYHHARRRDPWPGENYEGSTLRAALDGWLHVGICEEALWPYRPYPGAPSPGQFDLVGWEGAPDDGAAENARRYPLTSYFRLPNVLAVKRAIHDHGLALIGASVHTGWSEAGETIRFDKSSQPIGLHAFLLVGYDDFTKTFVVANSWGTSWGVEGFAQLSYRDLTMNMVDAWTASAPR